MTVKWLVAVAACASLFSFSTPMMAASLDVMFEEANAEFGEGNYEVVIDMYTRLEKLGVHSPALFYNRATSEARVGNLGRAIQYYEKVLAISPLDENTVYNLKVIRDHIARRANQQGRDADLAPAAGPWRAVLDRFTPMSASASFLVVYLLFFVALICRGYLKGEWIRLTIGVTAGILFAVSICMGAVLLGKRYQVLNAKEAVVVSVENDLRPVYEGLSSTVKRFDLEEGSRVQIIEQKNGWFKIRDDQGRDGWVKRQTLGRI